MQLLAANVHETTQFETILNALPTLHRKRGRPKWKPGKVHADKGYDSAKNRHCLKMLGITPRIARRGIENSERLGKHRWVVEQTFSHVHQFRRLSVRWERKAELHEAFMLLACSLICFRRLPK
jgi:IS5 family transposase